MELPWNLIRPSDTIYTHSIHFRLSVLYRSSPKTRMFSMSHCLRICIRICPWCCVVLTLFLMPWHCSFCGFRMGIVNTGVKTINQTLNKVCNFLSTLHCNNIMIKVELDENLNYVIDLLYPPQTKLQGYIVILMSVRSFVRPSVRPSQSLIRYSSKTTEQNFMKLSGIVHYMMP